MGIHIYSLHKWNIYCLLFASNSNRGGGGGCDLHAQKTSAGICNVGYGDKTFRKCSAWLSEQKDMICKQTKE